ncbi:MAG: DUF2062 domain-containing protein [Cryomorphaceae bacterium]|nr:MAG: DUF2062 domain-containing protein [Cryomorphaceae bacterium]
MTSVLDSMLRAADCCIVVPTYNNAPFLPALLERLAAETHRVVIVNDGSTDDTRQLLESYEDTFLVLHHDRNKGKGMALRNAFRAAWQAGYHHAITIDSDGQHLTEDLPKFLEEVTRHPGSMIVGARNMDQEGVPGKSSFGNRFSNFWFYVETFQKLPDTQSGYRLYPLEPISGMRFHTRKYEFEIEVLVRLAWRGVRIVSVPVSVIYHTDGSRITHFRPFHDFARISVLNTILVLLAFFYHHPRSFFRSLNWTNIKAFLNKNLLKTKASNAKLAAEVGFGVFMGIFPIWGYQMLVAAFVAHLIRFNKVVVLLASNISIPPMIPFIIYGSYMMGGWVIDTSERPLQFSTEISVADIGIHFSQYLLGAVMLSLTAGIAVGLLLYLLFLLFRKEPLKS